MRARSKRPIVALRRTGPLLAALFSIGVAAALIVQSIVLFQLDLSVFRDAGGAVRRTLPLYSDEFPSSSGFRFIYPPFAALLFAPMSWLSPALLQVLWTVLNIFLVWWVLRICLSHLSVQRASFVGLMLLGPTLLLEPIRSNFGFGKINIVLMALVLADTLRVAPRALRGAAMGLAAAVKITPAGFALLLIARRDIKAIGTAIAVFSVTVAVGFWLRPRDSTWFWLTEFFRDDRAGSHDFSRNQAITGFLSRLGLDGAVKDVVWLSAAIAVAAVAFWAARRFAQTGHHVVAVGVVALAVLLAAPIAVTHHWVYCILLVPLIVAPQYRSWRPLLVTSAAVFLVAPHFVLENTGSPAMWQQIGLNVVGGAQFLAAVALLAAAALAARRLSTGPDRADAPRPSAEPVLAGTR